MCQTRPGGSFCCQSIVSSLERGCSFVGPPCTIGGPNPSTPRWKNIDDSVTGKPVKRVDGCFVMADGKAFLLGGRGGAVKTNIFNPTNRTWTEGAPPPFEFHHANCIAVRWIIFVPVSWSGNFPLERQNSRMLVYDTRSDEWVTRAGLPEDRRRAAAGAALFNRKIWVVGGARNGHGPGSKTVGFFDYYDLQRKIWVTGLPNLPIPRDHTGAGIVKGRLCVAGGRTSDVRGFYSAVVVSTFCYHFKQKQWENVMAPIPASRADAMYGQTCSGMLMVAGGERGIMTPYRRVDLFDGEKWTTAPILREPRHGTGLAVASCPCGQIFVAGGQGLREDGMPLDSTEVFLPDGMDRICRRY